MGNLSLTGHGFQGAPSEGETLARVQWGVQATAGTSFSASAETH